MGCVKSQFRIATAAKIGGDVVNIQTLREATLQAVENRFDCRQAMLAAQSLVDQQFHELASMVRPSAPVSEVKLSSWHLACGEDMTFVRGGCP